MDDDLRNPDYLPFAAQIVSAYVGRNSVPASELPSLIQVTYTTLARLSGGPTSSDAAKPEPAVPIKKSVFPSYIICLEDGKKMKMLKRHLETSYGMTPDEYWTKWGLPAIYPMVAPDYAEKRSALAKSLGLGRRRAVAVTEPPAAIQAMPATKRAGRPRKSA